LTWNARKKNIEILEKESGAFVFAPGARAACALVYPNAYSVGMSNLGFHIIYRQLNQRGDIACERFFLPEGEGGAPLLSVETQRELADFPIIGVMLSFELDYFNLLAMLKAGGIPPAAAERGGQEPLLFAGGPCATFNPEPLAEVVDAFVIGEGEEAAGAVVDSWRQSRDWPDRAARLKALAQIPGVYVPAFYYPAYGESGKIVSMRHDPSVPAKVRRQWIKDIDRYAGHYQIITPLAEFANMFVIEVARGCGRHCRFCMAGYCFRRPRSRDLELIWQAITERPPSAAKVGLLGAAVCDYPYIRELTGRLVQASIPFSIASLRADAFDGALARALAGSGQRTLTIAPEAGSERLRKVINKGVSEDDILRALSLAADAGMTGGKLYFMLGLPTETDHDVIELANLVLKAKKYIPGKLSLSINYFVPKPFTPFQWDEPAHTGARLKQLRELLQKEKNIEIKAESLRASIAQQILSRAGRRAGEFLLHATQNGGLSEFVRRFKKEKPEIYDRADCLPWDHLDMGFSKEYLSGEREKAERMEDTPQCFAGCGRCGVCGGAKG
jgi:radical SAM superfamily enzyme YgiQ (UPF0313 family)